jgi:hypothetical protein
MGRDLTRLLLLAPWLLPGQLAVLEAHVHQPWKEPGSSGAYLPHWSPMSGGQV